LHNDFCACHDVDVGVGFEKTESRTIAAGLFCRVRQACANDPEPRAAMRDPQTKTPNRKRLGVGILVEREADDFASHLLMPDDALRNGLAGQPVDLRRLSELARRFDVSFEALCLRYIKHTDQSAILLHWDNGYLKYEWCSRSAMQSRIRIRRTSDPQEPLPGTVAADDDIAQHFDGVDLPMRAWCADAPPQAVLREFKHRYTQRNRVLTLLLLAPVAPVEDPPAGSVERPLQVAP
jgi:hypothetical protein